MNLRTRLTFGLPLLAATLVWVPASGASTDSKDVRVVNTPAEPVPVSATGTVGLAAGAQVGISGAVSLAPGTRVDVANTPDTPIHVTVPVESREVFVRTAHLEWIDSASNASTSIEVPSGKRLIIEYISGWVGTGEGQTVDFIVTTEANGGAGSFRFPTTGRRADHGGLLYDHTYRFAEAVRLYQDTGPFMNPLRITGSRAVTDPGPARGSFSLTGYLVDLPSPHP